jgi:hypothetical protein
MYVIRYMYVNYVYILCARRHALHEWIPAPLHFHRRAG